MKKFFYTLFAILAFVACSESDVDNGGNSGGGQTPPKQPEITLSTAAADFSTDGGSNVITFTSSEAWTAQVVNSRADEWCSIEPTSGPAGSAKITVTTTENDTPDDRTASIIIKAGTASKTINVSQKQKDALTVTSSKFEVSAEGGEVSIEVKANIDFDYTIEESAADWVEYKATRALKTSNLVFEVKENDDTDKREARIVISSDDMEEIVTIYQAGSEPSIILTENEFTVSSSAETIAVEVMSNVDVTVEIPNDVKWITENTTRAFSTNTYYFDIEQNDGYDNRTAEIKFIPRNYGTSQIVKITQEGREKQNSELNVQELKADNPLIYAIGGNTTIAVTSDVEWQAEITSPENCSWLTIKTSNNSLTLTTDQNRGSSDRIAHIRIKNNATSKEIIVKQRCNIIRRQEVNHRKVYNRLNITYDNNVFTNLITILPLPSTNIYQDVEGVAISHGGEVLLANDQETKYVRRVLHNADIPKSGECILREEFAITNYSVDVDFNSISSYIDIDTESEIYKKYTGQNGDIIVPDLPELQAITDGLWKASNGNVVAYAYNCYCYVAANMKYLNPNTGLHPLRQILSAGGGDCGNQVTLFVSMLRNKGIPARHVVLLRPDNTFHVRAEFFLAGYGWIPVDPNAKNLNPDGDFFGKIYSDEIVVHNDINIQLMGPENKITTTPLLQTYLFWYWNSSPVSMQITQDVGEINN